MKKTALFYIVLFAYYSVSNVQAQAFLNGSFEVNTAAACDYNMTNASFTAKMANATAYGLGGELDIMQTTCPYGPSQSGTWFVALACPSGNTDAFTMTLSAPLSSGITYTMSFWDKGDIACCPPGMPVIIGVSTVAGAAGTTVYTGPTPTGGVWTQRCFSFVAPNNGQYISVRTAGATRWSHVDNFVLNGSCTVLPVEWMKFDGFCRENGIVLKWSTASEINNDFFTVEHSANGIDFVEIGKVKGGGNSNKQIDYEFTDKRANNQTTYYRLKQNNADNSYKYSTVISVENCTKIREAIVEIFPNPAANEVIFKTATGGIDAALFSMYGTKIADYSLLEGENKIDITSLPDGMYYLKSSCRNENPRMNKLVIKR